MAENYLWDPANGQIWKYLLATCSQIFLNLPVTSYKISGYRARLPYGLLLATIKLVFLPPALSSGEVINIGLRHNLKQPCGH